MMPSPQTLYEVALHDQSQAFVGRIRCHYFPMTRCPQYRTLGQEPQFLPHDKGMKASRPKRRTQYWIFRPQASLRNFLCCGWIYFRSIGTNQSSDLIWLTIKGIVNILNLNLLKEWFNEVMAVEPRLPLAKRDWTSCSSTQPCSGSTTSWRYRLALVHGIQTWSCTLFPLYAGPTEIHWVGASMLLCNLLRGSVSQECCF